MVASWPSWWLSLIVSLWRCDVNRSLSADVSDAPTCVECGYFLISDEDAGIVELGPLCGDCEV